MRHSRLNFKLGDKVEVEVDVSRKQVVLHCETEDGRPLDLQCDYAVLERLRQEIRKQLDTY